MAAKGSSYKRLYQSKLMQWLIAVGVTGGVVGGLIFFYLATIGAIEIINYTPDYACAGTIEDPCEAIITFKALKNVYIYPFTEQEESFYFEPSVKSWKLYRSWGKGWRTIDLTKPWSTKVKYAIKFSDGKTYTVKIEALKNNPSDEIKWGFTDDLDPTFLGIGKEEIDDFNKFSDIEYKQAQFKYSTDMIECTFDEKINVSSVEAAAGGVDSFRMYDGKYKVEHSIPIGPSFKDKGKFITEISCNKEIYPSGYAIYYETQAASVNTFGQPTMIPKYFQVDYSMESSRFKIDMKQLNKNTIRVEIVPLDYSEHNDTLVIDPLISEFTASSFTGGTFTKTENTSTTTDLRLLRDARLIWKFDINRTSNNITDWSSYLVDGTNSDTAQNVVSNEGQYGTSMKFAGVSPGDFLRAPLTDVSGVFGSVELWFNPIGDCGNSSSFTSSSSQIIRIGDVGANDYNDIFLVGPNTGSQTIGVFKGDTNSFAIASWDCSILTGDTWNHVVITWNTSDKLILYVNGISRVTDTDDETAVPNFITMGRNDAGNNIYRGFTDNVIIYKRVLTADEVLESYNGTNARGNYNPAYYQQGNYTSVVLNVSNITQDWTITYWNGTLVDDNIQQNFDCSASNVVGCWPFDQNVSEMSSSDVICTNFASQQTSPGIIGNSSYFGENDWINCSQPSALNLTANYTMCTFAKVKFAPPVKRHFMGDFNNGSIRGRALYMLSDGYVYFAHYKQGVNEGGAVISVANASVLTNDNKFHHYCGVFDTVSGAKIYLDGRPKTNDSTTILPINTSLLQFTFGQATLGADNVPGQMNDSFLDNAIVFNRALSETEVYAYYRDQLGTLAKVRFATSSDSENFSSWNDYNTNSLSSKIDVSDSQYIKYEFYLETNNTVFTPDVDYLDINYVNSTNNCSIGNCWLQWVAPGLFEVSEQRWFVVYFDLNTSTHTLPSYADAAQGVMNFTAGAFEKISNYAYHEWER